LARDFKIGLVKDLDTYGNYIQKRSHWTKYERFLKNNNISYMYINIKSSDWIKQVELCNLLIFRPDISPSAMHDASSKIYFIENYLKINCFPSYNELWSYEEKVRANYLFNFFIYPHVSTFISNDKAEVLAYLKTAKFPIVSKIASGSASRGVKLLRSKLIAKNLTNKIFAEGASTYWAEYRQKDYVYFQNLFQMHFLILEL
jgi:glutathione synthase/RimK-type ligase-like ATP-grasp enzyme